jgi:predicted phage tail protein
MGGGYDYVAQRTSPITVSFRIDLPHSGRWEIRAFRNSDKNLNGTVGHDIAWVGLRGFLEPSRVYGQCTVLAMQIKNTANSSVNDQSAHQIVVTGTRKLPIYNGSTWSAPTATRSIAWAVADMLKNTTYGGKRSDTDFDLAELFALDAIWTARGDKFDYYAAQTTTLWAALGIALRAGRAVPYHQSGVVRFHRDAPQTVPTMLFSAENIVKGSFQMNFILPSPEDETDAIQVDYLSELDWLQESIILPKPGVISPQAPSQNKLDGVVQTTQAQNEAAYMLAADQYRRVLLSWDTELEGLIASRGDLVLVQHDMPRWGQSTRVYDWNPTTKTVTLWGRIEYDGGVWFAYFRDRQGRASTETYIDSYDDNDLTLRLPSAPVYPSGLPFDMTATRSEPLHVVVGKSVAVPRQAIFLGAVPRGGKTVSITAVLEDSRVHVN